MQRVFKHFTDQIAGKMYILPVEFSSLIKMIILDTWIYMGGFTHSVSIKYDKFKETKKCLRLSMYLKSFYE